MYPHHRPYEPEPSRERILTLLRRLLALLATLCAVVRTVERC